jgi:hypothetical protein
MIIGFLNSPFGWILFKAEFEFALKGRGFSRAVNAIKRITALAAAGTALELPPNPLVILSALCG